MSRIAKAPVNVPSGVDVAQAGQDVTVKGPKGTLTHTLHREVEMTREDGMLKFAPRSGSKPAMAQAGTARALINNLVQGVSSGFERRLQLIGVGYRAQMQGKALNLSLGFSHPVEYPVPEGIEIETPSQTEIIVRGVDKQRVGQVSAEIRAYRPPEPYKGKGVRYADEHVVRKEAKKK
ncbi:MAG: 50S ribosomal protein L6 [Gammaproteobacteria bacterium]|nr:50S ribosomal protein L6 [Gammaproteobacteria bacterium]